MGLNIKQNMIEFSKHRSELKLKVNIHLLYFVYVYFITVESIRFHSFIVKTRIVEENTLALLKFVHIVSVCVCVLCHFCFVFDVDKFFLA